MAALVPTLAQLVAAAPADAPLQTRRALAAALFTLAPAVPNGLAATFEACEEAAGSSSSGSGVAAATAAAGAALAMLDKTPSAPQSILRQFACVYVRLVAGPLAGDSALQRELMRIIAIDVLAGRRAHQAMRELLHGLLVRLTDILDQDNKDTCSSTVASTMMPAVALPADISAACTMLPATAAAELAAELLDAALDAVPLQQVNGGSPPPPQQPDSDMAASLVLAVGPLFTTACGLLSSSDGRLRLAVFQTLLPALLRAAGSKLGDAGDRRACLHVLRSRCVHMLHTAGLPRRIGLAVLLQYHAEWDMPPPTAAAACGSMHKDHGSICDSSSHGGASSVCEDAGVSAADQVRFWAALQVCLWDGEPLNRKRAARLLQLLLADDAARPCWGALLALLELLEGFSAHLVKEAWHTLDTLHPPAPRWAAVGQGAEADVARSSRIDPLRRAQQQARGGDTVPAVQAASAAPALPFAWSRAVWELALRHRNLQVQRMALRSLLKRHWPPELLATVPAEFWTATLFPALLVPMHHRPSAAQRMPSEQDGGSMMTAAALTSATVAGSLPGPRLDLDVVAETSLILADWVAAAGPAPARDMLHDALALLAGSGRQELPRTGALALLQCLAAAAATSDTHDGLEGASGPRLLLLQDLLPGCAAAYAVTVLDQLRTLVARVSSCQGHQFRTECFRFTLCIAAAVAPPGVASLSRIALLLQAYPGWMLGPGGLLHHDARAWLLGCNSHKLQHQSEWQRQRAASLQDSMLHSWRHCFASSTTAAAAAATPAARVAPVLPNIGHIQLQEADVVQVEAWLRLALCCNDELHDVLHTALIDLSENVAALPSRTHLAPGSAQRTLTALATALEEGEAAGRVAGSASTLPALPALTQWAVWLSQEVQAPLLQHLDATLCCYAASPAELAAPCSAGGWTSRGLSEDAVAAVAQAEGAVRAGVAAAVLLARRAAGAWHVQPAGAGIRMNGNDDVDPTNAAATASGGSVGGGAAAVTATDGNSLSNGGSMTPGASCASDPTVMPVLLRLAHGLAAAGQRLADLPRPVLPLPTADASTLQSCSTSPQLAAAAALQQCRASLLHVLTQLALGLSRSLTLLPDRQLREVIVKSCRPESWLMAVLREGSAADAAREAWASVAGGAAAGDPLAGWPSGTDWRACDATMGLTAQLASVQDLLPSADAAQLLVGVLASLEWTSCEPGSELPELLRCLRRLWVKAVLDQVMQNAAAERLDALGSLPDADGGTLGRLAGAIGTSLLNMLAGAVKRSQQLYGQVVSCLLLPQLCVLPGGAAHPLAALHVSMDAPLRRFVRGLLQQGLRGSPRLMLALALQLAAYLASCPVLVSWYADELRQLLLFGTTSHNTMLDATALALPCVESEADRQALAEPLDAALQEAYALTDIGPRVAVVCGLHELACAAGLGEDKVTQAQQKPLPGLAAQQREEIEGHPQQEEEDAGKEETQQQQQQQQTVLTAQEMTVQHCDHAWVAEAEAAGVLLWSSWMQALTADEQLSSDRYKSGSDTHRRKVRCWQGLAAAGAFLTSPRQRDAAAAAASALLSELGANNPPSVKQYQESLLTSLLLAHPGLAEELLLPALQDVSRGTTATGSQVLVAVRVALHSPPERAATLRPAVLLLLLPWMSHHGHHTRTFAQLGYAALCDAAPLHVWPGWSEGLGPGGVQLAEQALRFMVQNEDFQRFRNALGPGIADWSPVGATSPRRIFSTTTVTAGLEATPITFEGVPFALMDWVAAFLTTERAKLREAAADRAVGYELGTVQWGRSGDESGSTGAAAPAAMVNYQRKVTPSERAAMLADVLDEVPEGQGGHPAPTAPLGVMRHDLIVVASLIDKVPNLGGLARTVEVLGAGALVLSDLRFASEAGFTSVSVTAERWVPLIEVKEAALLGWLAAKKTEGYTLVGLEQTAESVPLPEYSFPRRTVMLLGREKEGIPPEVIAMLDATVEIPQLGLIRSLNVHVSGAIAMYEYVQQRLREKCATG